MSVERTFYCDGPDCEQHIRTQGDHPPTFLTVKEDGGDDIHLCSWDCAMKFAAKFEPTETIPFHDDGETDHAE